MITTNKLVYAIILCVLSFIGLAFVLSANSTLSIVGTIISSITFILSGINLILGIKENAK